MRLNRVLEVHIVLALVLGVAATQIGVASAARPVETEFMLSFAGAEVEVEVLPSGTIVTILHRIEFTVSGDWDGEWEHSGFAIISPTGTFFAFAFGTFRGTILGEGGTADVRLETHGFLTDPSDLGTFELLFSRLTILGGTGDLSDVHGHGVEEELGTFHASVVFDGR